MTIRDRLRRLENNQPLPLVQVWLSTPDDPDWLTNAVGERRQRDELGDLFEVTLTIDCAGDDSEDEQ